jgi:hypothetical protein
LYILYYKKLYIDDKYSLKKTCQILAEKNITINETEIANANEKKYLGIIRSLCWFVLHLPDISDQFTSSAIENNINILNKIDPTLNAHSTISASTIAKINKKAFTNVQEIPPGMKTYSPLDFGKNILLRLYNITKKVDYNRAMTGIQMVYKNTHNRASQANMRAYHKIAEAARSIGKFDVVKHMKDVQNKNRQQQDSMYFYWEGRFPNSNTSLKLWNVTDLFAYGKYWADRFMKKNPTNSSCYVELPKIDISEVCHPMNFVLLDLSQIQRINNMNCDKVIWYMNIYNLILLVIRSLQQLGSSGEVDIVDLIFSFTCVIINLYPYQLIILLLIGLLILSIYLGFILLITILVMSLFVKML